MSVLSNALKQASGEVVVMQEGATRLKATGNLSGMMDGGYGSTFDQWQSQAKYNQRYDRFRGTLYSAINAIAEKGAEQSVRVGKMPGKEDPNKKPGKTKASVLKSMTKVIRTKAEVSEIEVIDDHPILRALENPNSVQSRWQFVYSFIANLCLTGWSYVIMDVKKDGTPEMWSVPTTWVKPDHSKGPFSRFKLGNPNKPGMGWKDIPRENVGFAHLPNPADPLSALAPTGSQMTSIRISDHIETSREQFFHNGIFPSVVVTVGKNPHPDVAAQFRPRLSPKQRRQVYSVIRRSMQGVANYGNPAIVDGLIESVDRLSMTQTEMGWEKSEKSVESKILSAFRVHPFILGREMNVGGWSQATIIRQLFYDRVNTYLDFLGMVVTQLVGGGREDNTLLIWWEPCEAKDPTQYNQLLRFARQNNDVTQDELRSMLGLGPDEDRNEQVIEKSTLQGIAGLVSNANLDNSQTIAILEGLGLPSDLAKKIAGPKKPKPDPNAMPPIPPGQPGQPTNPGQKPPQNQQQQEEEEQPTTPEEAMKAVKLAIEEIRKTDISSARRIAQWVVDLASSS